MTLTQGQLDILRDFGVRCCNCGRLATRVQVLDHGNDMFCSWGPLAVSVNHLLVSEYTEWIKTNFIGRIENNFEEAKSDPCRFLGSYANMGYFRSSYSPEFCDSCGDPSKNYEELRTAYLIREIPKDLPQEPEVVPSILERLLEK